MYERLQGYQSIDKLVQEQGDFMIERLNAFPLYNDIVKALKSSKQSSYSIGIFVKQENGQVLHYMSRNGPEGKIEEIVSCDEDSPDFAITVGERWLLRICNEADSIRTKIEAGDIAPLITYLNPLPLPRKRNFLQFARLIKLVPRLIDQYRRIKAVDNRNLA